MNDQSIKHAIKIRLHYIPLQLTLIQVICDTFLQIFEILNKEKIMDMKLMT